MKLSTRHSHWLEISVSREGVSNVVVGVGGVEGAWGEKKRKKGEKLAATTFESSHKLRLP